MQTQPSPGEEAANPLNLANEPGLRRHVMEEGSRPRRRAAILLDFPHLLWRLKTRAVGPFLQVFGNPFTARALVLWFWLFGILRKPGFLFHRLHRRSPLC